MRGVTTLISIALTAVFSVNPTMAAGFGTPFGLAAFSAGSVGLLMAPSFVSASKGKPIYNAADHPLPSDSFKLPKLNWTSDSSPVHTVEDRQFGAKRGIVYQAGADSDASEFTDESQIGWAYNWAPNHGDLVDVSSLEWIPMLWTLYSKESSSIQDQWNLYTESNAAYTHVLGYNEPDQPASAGGSSISATDAAAAWPGDMDYHGQYQDARAKFYLGSPAISAGAYTWMDTFIDNCNDCEFDFFAVHWYGECNVDSFTGYLEEYKDRYMANGQPMWVTEFGFEGCASDCVEAQTIVSAINWLESTSWIERYAYFGNIGTGVYGGDMCFLNSDKSWTLQGYAYINAVAAC